MMLVSMTLIVIYDLHHNINIYDRYIIYSAGAFCGVGLPVLIAIRIIRIARVIIINKCHHPRFIFVETILRISC